MTITANSWQAYINGLRTLNETAAKIMSDYLRSGVFETNDQIREAIRVAYRLATKYGEGSAELACEMYDSLAELSGKMLPAAVPAETATYSEVAATVRGTMNHTMDAEAVGASVGRLVKLAGVDTVMQNALRDGAQWAWIPSGDTCAYCMMLASNGWQNASEKAIRNGHAEHIHSRCDCTYAVRFDHRTNVEGYDPSRYKRIYDHADGNLWQEKLNAMRRDLYEENKDEINAQKREAYARRKEREASSTEGLLT